MKTLNELAVLHGTDKSSCFHNYAEKYDAILTPRKDRVRKVLEFGVKGGASLKMWRDFFTAASIYGFDCDKSCKKHEGERVTIVFGNEKKPDDIRSVMAFGPFDLIVDDGDHTCKCQIETFEAAWGGVAPGGMYIVEDIHTSYTPDGGLGKSAVDYFRTVIDWVNFYGFRNKWMERREDHIIPFLPKEMKYPRDVLSVAFFNGFIVVEKRK